METLETAEPVGDEPNTQRRLLALFILGFSIVIVGVVLIAVAALLSQGGSTSVGGIILLGPFPIVFGAGPGAQWLILFAIILTVLSVIMLLTLHRKAESTRA